MTTTISAHFSSLESISAEASKAKETIAAETAKARESLQADLIKKFVDTPNPQTVRANLRFLVDVGLVPTYATSLQEFLDRNPDSALPSAFSLGTSALQNVHTDDDAIDLVMRTEGGFIDDPQDPLGTMKYGLSVRELSSLLGRDASKDDLKNLSFDTAREIYRNEYLNGAASAIASVQLKATYLGLATFSGRIQANKFFQAAVGKIDKLPIAEDGELNNETIRRINAIEPNLLIETVNCEDVKYIKSLASFEKFGLVWMRRLRAFSPVTLKGVCPELRDLSISGTTPSRP